MCGIVGYIGPKDPKEVLLKGLQSLEYRGYDSAGVSIFHQGAFKRVRAQGKLVHLEAKLKQEHFDGSVGIGHTRWATHGIPSELNAHPHCVKGISIVHNGIIENYVALRNELAQSGAQFESQTDSELIAHLIAAEIDQGENLFASVVKILPKLRGAYSILAVNAHQPNEMVAFKNGPPLLAGVTEQEIIVASDLQAIMPHTRHVLYLNDDEILHIQGKSFAVYDRVGRVLDRTTTEVSWSPELVEKAGFAHFMLKEIYEQPRAVAHAMAPHLDIFEKSVRLNNIFREPQQSAFDAVQFSETDWAQALNLFKKTERIFIIACGTSYYAGMVGKYHIEKLARVPVEVDIASEFRYRDPIFPENSLLVVISQSGETADTLAAVRLAKSKNISILSICNVPRSSIDRESDARIYMNAGIEIGVASTKALSSTLVILSILALSVAKAKSLLPRELEVSYVDSLLAVPAHLEQVLAYDQFFREAATSLHGFRGFLYMGRGASYPIALEGALKLKELAYLHAEGYAAGEMKHGPLALIDHQMAIVMLAPSDELFEKTVSNLEEAKARGGRVIAIGTGPENSLKAMSDHYLSLPEGNQLTTPLFELIPLQLMAYHLAQSLGHDVDQPRNLAKSVTVE